MWPRLSPTRVASHFRLVAVSETFMRGLRIALLFSLLSLASCHSLPPRATLPEAHELKVGQLVFHSDFDLPADHRLVRDLVDERENIYGTLGLTSTNEPIEV